MKKISTLFAIAALLAGFNSVHAQAPKYALFEEFTNDGCGPCAMYNPGFESLVLAPNPNTVREISYHTPGPGPDQMYDAAASQINAVLNYYGIQYVPTVNLLGNLKSGSPAEFSQADVDNVTAGTSPVSIKVKDIDNGTDHSVTVTITCVGTPPTGTNYKLRTAIIERNKTFTSPPGSNGEKYFPNVFRQMLPGTAGDVVTFPAQGQSISFEYSYTEDTLWNMSDIGLVSYVQDDNTKEILNCGASFDPTASVINSANLTSAGVPGTISTFTLKGGNNGDSTATFKYSLSSNAPSDWSANFVINTITYSDSATVSLEANGTQPVTINVTPGATPAIAAYTLTIKSITNPTEDPITSTVYVISGITDLVVNNDGGRGDGLAQNASHWESVFLNGLSAAGSKSYASMFRGLATTANRESSLAGVKNIYYNVGWTFPAFTDDWVEQLENFMNAGGNLFISGQDIGWDISNDASAGGHATPASQDFYTNYMYAQFLNDGDGTDKPLTANPDDAIFGALGSNVLLNYYASSTGVNFFPDEIAPLDVAVPIFYYNNNTDKVAGIRADNGTYKIVYIAPGPEMLASVTSKNNIIKTVYDWFYGITGVESIDQAFQQLGQNYPNPTDQSTFIPLSNVKESYTFMLTDVTGHIMMTKPVSKGASSIEVNTSSLPQGMYFYRLSDGVNSSSPMSLQVIH